MESNTENTAPSRPPSRPLPSHPLPSASLRLNPARHKVYVRFKQAGDPVNALGGGNVCSFCDPGPCLDKAKFLVTTCLVTPGDSVHPHRYCAL